MSVYFNWFCPAVKKDNIRGCDNYLCSLGYHPLKLNPFPTSKKKKFIRNPFGRYQCKDIENGIVVKIPSLGSKNYNYQSRKHKVEN